MDKYSLISNKDIKLTIYLKLNQLHRHHLENINYSHLMDVLFQTKWNKQYPRSIHEAVNDIMSLDANEIVKELHTLAIIKGATQNSDIIEELLGGN